MNVIGLRIQVEGDIELVQEMSTGDFIKLDKNGDVELRLVAGSDEYDAIKRQVGDLLNKGQHDVVPGKLTDNDHLL